MNETLLHTLDLFYEKTYISAQLTDEPSGQLDVEAFMDGKEHCWQSLGNTKQFNKKHLILTSWYFQYLNHDSLSAFTDFFSDLIATGFIFYIPEQQQLIKIIDKTLLPTKLKYFTPISSAVALKLAANLQLSNENTLIINTQRLHQLARTIKENDLLPYAANITPSLCHYYPELPGDLNAEQLQYIETHLESGDKLGYVLQKNTAAFPSKTLGRHIYSLRIDDESLVSQDDLNADSHFCNNTSLLAQHLSKVIDVIQQLTEIELPQCHHLVDIITQQQSKLLPSVDRLTMRNSSITTEQCSTILGATSQLTMLNVEGSPNAVSTLLQLKPAMLNQITALTLSALPINAHELATILDATPHLTSLSIAYCKNFGKNQLNLKPGALCQLTQLTANSSSITKEQFFTMIAAAPYLTTIDISQCQHHLSVALSNLTPRLLSHLTTFASDPFITAKQLSTIMKANAKLTSISLLHCKCLGTDPIEIKPNTLHLLTTLIASNSAITSRQLADILNVAPQLSTLTLSGCQYLGEENIHLTTATFAHLVAFTAEHSSITDEQLLTVIQAAPRLTSISIRQSIKPLSAILIHLKPGLLNHLTTFEPDSFITVEQFASITEAAPWLTTISLFSCQNFGTAPLINLQPDAFGHLTKLTADNSFISIEQFSAIIKNTPQLVTLNINACRKLGTALPHLALDELHFLKEFIASNSSITIQQCAYIIQKAPNLATLNLDGCHGLGVHPFELSPDNTYSHLTAFTANNSSISFDQLSSFIQAAWHLTTINISNCIKLGTSQFHLELGKLNHLRTLTTQNSTISLEQLSAIINAAPDLRILDISYCNKFGRSLFTLNANALSHLTELYAHSSFFFPEQISVIIEAAPNLSPFYAVNYTHLRSIRRSNLITDGNFSYDPTKIHQARQLFTGHSHHPSPKTYHLKAYVGKHGFSSIEYSPSLSTLENIDAQHFSSFEHAFHLFQNDPKFSTANHFYAGINLGKLIPNYWYQLPVLSTGDQLLGFAIQCDDYKIKRDKVLGYYYLSVSNIIASCFISYIIETPFTIEKTQETSEDIQYLIQKLQFMPTGKLLENEAYQQLTQYSPDILLSALVTFCRFPYPFGKAVTGTPAEMLNYLIKYRVGACRHRAGLFVALASNLTLDAFMICNDIHAFVIILDDKQHRYTIDLGGSPIHLNLIPTRPFPKQTLELPANLNVKQLEQYELLAIDNPFQTWNTLPIKAKNMQELAKELQHPESPTQRHLVIMGSQQLIEALHEASLEGEGEGQHFFSPNLDTMSLKTIRADETFKKSYDIIDSPLAAFIKHAQKYPVKTLTWFINWCYPKPEHVGLNSIIDDVGRRLGDLELPDNLQIVALIDATSAALMQEDFYSRFDALSQATHINAGLSILADTNTIRLIEPQDACITLPNDWKKELLGSYAIEGQHIVFTPGALIKAIHAQTSNVNIHNPPWDNVEFRWFAVEWLKTKRFFANGRWRTFPEHSHINFVKSLFRYPPLEQPLVEAQTFILNPASYAQFFPHYRVSQSEGIQPCPGFLGSEKSLRLIVTDDVSEPQWYKLWQQACEYRCKIELQGAPNTTVPDALIPRLTPITQYQSCDRIRLVVSNDLDFAEAQSRTQCQLVIPVHHHTLFSALFFQISRQKQDFSSEETSLLQAIREKKTIVFKGQFSKSLAQQMRTLFTPTPYLYVNGTQIVIDSSILFITDDSTPFVGVMYTTIHYEPDHDLRRLEQPLQHQLQAGYQSFHVIPCHGHFMDLPDEPQWHHNWVKIKLEQLQMAAGQSIHADQSVRSEDILDYLKHHPFLFLLAETGAGKSYFVQRVLPEFCKSNGLNISIYQGLNHLKSWASAKSDAFLFIDETNLSAEHFSMFDNMANGDQTLWMDGQNYPLSPNHKIIFAGNPKQYEGRFEANLFKRFPYYFEFKGQDLKQILNPLLPFFKDNIAILLIIESYYQNSIQAGLTITPRNAQMICLTTFILKQLPLTRHMPEILLIQYAALHEIQSLPGKRSVQPDQTLTQWDVIYQALISQLPLLDNRDFIWTESRKKMASIIQTVLNIRQFKISNNIEPATGINGLVIEGEPGLGKSRLIIALLNIQQIPYVTITIGNPETMRQQLLDVFHTGKIAIIEELNSFSDEQFLNAVLSGTDMEGKKPTTPGFFLLCSQNPITYLGRTPLSKALSNRLMIIHLHAYEAHELHQILEEKFKLPKEKAIKLTASYLSARQYADQQKFFPPPNTRTLFKQAKCSETPVCSE